VKKILLLALSLSCGSDTPPCATADCTVPGSTIIKWEFDHDDTRAFPDDSCNDLGVTTVHVDAIAPVGGADAMNSMSQDVPCGNGQATFVGLAPGTYDIALSPLGPASEPLTSGPQTAQIAAAPPGMTTMTTIEVPYTAWTGTYTGTFLFRVTWGGMSCPAQIVNQTLALTAGGQLVHQADDPASGAQKLDGTDVKPCVPSSMQFPSFIDSLPFGPATFVVTGQDGAGSAVLQHSFDTFVGAAKNNPTLTFDVPVPVDAGIDAPIDAPTDAPPD
jgi:hypothetical protein